MITSTWLRSSRDLVNSMACNIGVSNFVHTCCSTWQWSDLPVAHVKGLCCGSEDENDLYKLSTWLITVLCPIYSFVVFQHTFFFITTLFDCATHIVMLSLCVAPYFPTQLARLTKCWWSASSAINRPLLVVIRVPFPNFELVIHLRCNYDLDPGKIEGCTSFSSCSCPKQGTLGHRGNVSH